MRHRFRSALFWLAVIVLSSVTVFLYLNNPSNTNDGEPFGTLAHRFDSSLELEWDGSTWNYRDQEVINVLISGVDQGEFAADNAGFRAGGQADFLMLVAIDRRNKTITPIQIDRDTIAEIDILGIMGDPAGTRQTQICLAQSFGSTGHDRCQNVVTAVSRYLFGIPIHYYAALDLSAIPVINDALGGVTVTIREDLSNLDPAMTQGAVITLQGSQAETFVRSRTSVQGDKTNVGRMQRQREYIISAADKIIQGMEHDKNYAPRLLKKLDGHILTNIPLDWLNTYLGPNTKYVQVDPLIPEGEHIIGKDGFVEFHPDYESLKSMLIGIHFRKGSN